MTATTVKKVLLLLVGVVLYFNIGQLFLEWLNFAITNPATISAKLLNPFGILTKEGVNNDWMGLLLWPAVVLTIVVQQIFVLGKVLLAFGKILIGLIFGGITKFFVG